MIASEKKTQARKGREDTAEQERKRGGGEKGEVMGMGGEMFLSFFLLLFTLIDMKGRTKWGKRANERT